MAIIPRFIGPPVNRPRLTMGHFTRGLFGGPTGPPTMRPPGPTGPPMNQSRFSVRQLFSSRGTRVNVNQ